MQKGVRTREAPVSLAPLDLGEALAGLLLVKPQPEPKPKRKKAPPTPVKE